MQKGRTKYHDKLVDELTLLRKVSGVTPAKMHYKIALRGIAARAIGVDDNKITNSQIHSFLLGEIAKLPPTTPFTALRHAFGLAEIMTTDGKLSQRRRALALDLDKHEDTVVRYENQAISDLAAHLEAASGNTRPRTRTQTNTSPTALHRIIRDTVKLSLPGLLPVANRGPELLEYLEQSQRPYLETSVDIKLTPSSRGVNWYRLKVKYTFTGRRDTFRLAVVMNGEDGEQLLAQGLVDEFQKLNDTIDPRQEIRTVRNNSRFMAYNPTLRSQKLFRFRELDPIQAQTLLQSTTRPLKAPLRVLEVKLPIPWQSEGIVYEYRSTFSLRDDIHYAYWYAPSMMFVKKISFDYSEFPQVDRFDFVTIPLLGNVTGNSTRKEYSFVVRPNSWVMSGNGIVAVWEVKP